MNSQATTRTESAKQKPQAATEQKVPCTPEKPPRWATRLKVVQPKISCSTRASRRRHGTQVQVAAPGGLHGVAHVSGCVPASHSARKPWGLSQLRLLRQWQVPAACSGGDSERCR